MYLVKVQDNPLGNELRGFFFFEWPKVIIYYISIVPEVLQRYIRKPYAEARK